MENEFFSEHRLFGLSAPSIPDYRFCWLLNRSMGLSFQRLPESDIQSNLAKENKRKVQSLFENIAEEATASSVFYPVYRHYIGSSDFSIFLYGNKSEGQCLISELPSVDYFLLFPSISHFDEYANLLLYHRIKGITWIKPLEMNLLKSKKAFML